MPIDENYRAVGNTINNTQLKNIISKMAVGNSLLFNEEFNPEFLEFILERYKPEIDKAITGIINIPVVQQDEENLVDNYIIDSDGFFYVDVPIEDLKTKNQKDKVIKIINFNHFGYIIKKIFGDSYINDYTVLEDKISLTKDVMDEVNFIIKELYFGIKKMVADRLEIKSSNLSLLIYMPDFVHWTITVSTGSLIYAVMQDIFLYSDGVLVKTTQESKNAIAERIASIYGIRIEKKFFFKGLKPEADVVIKLLSALNNAGFNGDLGEFYMKSKGLGKLLVHQLLDTTEIEKMKKNRDQVFVQENVIEMFAKDYIDFINEINILPAELKTLKEELLQYEKVIGLGIIEGLNTVNNDNSNPIRIEYLRLRSEVENFEIKEFGHNISSFVKFLTNKDITNLDLPPEYLEYLKDTEKDKKDIEETVKNFDRIFRERIIGQDQVIGPLWSVLKKWYIGIRNEKPVGSFLFCGPTGVGKTETAKLLADNAFGNLITLDMSEYQTEIDVTKIIGVAPGYSGYDQGAGILDKIAANPRSIILFDEIEKAHYKVFDLLLQVLDEGRLTDHKGNIVSFKECFVICTTNAHYNEIEHLGDNARSKMIEILCGSFRKEFLARFNDVLKYNQLSDETMERIFDLKIEKEIEEVSKSTGIEIIIIEDENYFKVKSTIINLLDNSLGARELQRIIFQDIVSKIIDYVAETNDYREKIVFYFDTMRELKVSMLEVEGE